MKLQSSSILRRANWGIISALFVVSQFGPLTLLANTANATPVFDYQLASSHGTWTAVNGGSNVNGINTNEVRWGITEGQQSGLRYDGSGSQGFNENDKINLGKLTHYNFPINNAANGATLRITLKFDSPGVAPDPTFTFQFNIDETANVHDEDNCASWHTPGFPPCDDMITFPHSFPTQSFTIGDKLYTLKIDGFSTTTNGSNPISQFITHEGQSNEAYLIGSLSSVLVEAPQLTLVKKTVEGQDANVAPGPSLTVGNTAHFAYVVQNTGNVTLTNIAIVDDRGVVATCAQTTLSAGASTTCTGTQAAIAGQYTNIAYATGVNGTQTITSNTDPANYFGVPRPGNLTVVKTVQNPNGGNAVASNFTVHVKDASGADVTGSPATGSTTGSQYSLAPGVYTVSEDSPAVLGYRQVSVTCDGQPSSTVTVTSDTTKVCTILNEDTAPSITLIKAFSGNRYGDTTSVNDFGLSIGGTTVNSGQKYNVKANTVYAINEVGHAGYQFNSISGDAKCPTLKGGNTAMLNPGENITCTITNTAQAPSLNVTKIVTNNNGGDKYAWDFSLYANNILLTDDRKVGGDIDYNSVTYLVSNAIDGEHTLAGEYTLSEDALAGYSPTSWTCTGNSTPLKGATVTVKLGENVNCEITNDDDAPALTLVKKLVNNYATGTSADPTESDWVLTANGPQLIQVTGNKDGVKTEDIKQGTYNLDESSQKWADSTYTSAWSCVKASLLTNLATPTSGNSVTVGLGETYSCTVTNTMKPATLIVEKEVINDDGGASVAGDFSFNYTSGTTTVFEQLETNSLKAKNELLLSPGSYTVTEVKKNGYEASYTNCDNVVITYGETKTCVVKNNDIAPKLTLLKDVTNNNGGTAEAKDWTLTATPASNTVGATTISGNGATGVDEVAAKAGVEYTLSESSVAGYEFKGWTCEGGTLIGTKLTLALDTNVTCTVKNDDIAPKLTLEKKVIKDNDGNASPSDWTLKAAGETTISGAGGVSSGDTFKAGTYTLSEYGGPSGYTPSAWTCTNGVTVNAENEITVTNTTDTKCTITNDDDYGTIIVKKFVKNDDGGTKTAGDFSFTLDGKTYPFVEDSEDELYGEVSVPVDAGRYSVVENEANQNGYDTSYSDGSECDYSRDISKVLSIQTEDDCYDDCGYECAEPCENMYVGNGQTVVCEITNDDIAPKLTLVKEVINNNSGNAESSDWTLTATPAENTLGAKTISGNGEDGVEGVRAKANVAYTLTESGPSGYAAGEWYCEGGELDGNILIMGLDENVACYIENNDSEHPAIKVVKSGPANAKVGDVITYTFVVTNIGDTPLSAVTVSDNIAGKGVYQSGDFNNNKYLDLTETWVYTAQYTIPSGAAGTQVNNTVKACGIEVSLDEEWSRSETSTQTVCDEDTHTLNVATPELVNTGAGNTTLLSILVAGTMFGGIFAVTRRPRVHA